MSIDLPEVQQGELDAEGLAQLFADVAGCGELLAVISKRGRREYVRDEPLTLEAAQTELLAGSLRGVQLRYRFEGKEWWDTLLAAQGRFRLTRIAHEL